MTAPIWRGVARRLGQWHAVLPISAAATESTPALDATTIGIHQIDVDSENQIRLPNDRFSQIQPRRPGPNLWTVLQKWILALPVGTEEERARRLSLQKELEWIVRELDDGQGLGEDGVCIIIRLFVSCLRLTDCFLVGLRPLRPSEWQRHRRPTGNP